ncbi:cytochrome c oxidase accessory protein CcoG [Hyphobacterium sp. CCMP332]|nr:cytochrome c oxidase accessory protein CcoG [Hyphobacterium sp. CCMP332]
MGEPKSAYFEEELYDKFRNTPSTVNDDNKRRWIFPKMPSGKWHRYRLILGYTILLTFVALPFIQYNGKPFFLVNIFDRKFIFFGQVYWPQDIFIIVIGVLTLMVSIILFTVVYGRVFCGWTCPQTLFMELVFRKIEYFFEGDYRQQMKLNSMPWNAEKIRKKGLKHLFFIFLSIFFGHVVMAYLVGMPRVLELISSNPLDNLAGFSGLVIFTGIFYLVFSQVREIVCTVICPYGRLQGVLLNKESMVVAYDYNRGEPRGKIKKGEDNTQIGDCIDCKLCVHVCPTGIDIRNGTQMECINCTACIDECNSVMDKIKRPRGLIRFDSILGIENKIPFKFTARVAAYSLVLLVLLGAFGFFTTTRTDVETTVMRVPGQLYQKTDDGKISNLFNLQIVNKTFIEKSVRIELGEGFEGEIKIIGGDEIIVPAQGSVESVFFIETEEKNITEMKNKVNILVLEGDVVLTRDKTNFLGPVRIISQ